MLTYRLDGEEGIAMKWENLTEAQLTRLCECRSRKSDIVPIAIAYKNESGYDSENALICALEHLCMNSQFFDLTSQEWNDAISKLDRI